MTQVGVEVLGCELELMKVGSCCDLKLRDELSWAGYSECFV